MYTLKNIHKKKNFFLVCVFWWFPELIRFREIFAIQVTFKYYFVGLLVCLQFNTLLEMFSTLRSHTCLWFCVFHWFFVSLLVCVLEYPWNKIRLLFVCVFLWVLCHCKSHTSGCRGDFWSKDVMTQFSKKGTKLDWATPPPLFVD